jgi:hypothetical protein
MRRLRFTIPPRIVRWRRDLRIAANIAKLPATAAAWFEANLFTALFLARQNRVPRHVVFSSGEWAFGERLGIFR